MKLLISVLLFDDNDVGVREIQVACVYGHKSRALVPMLGRMWLGCGEGYGGFL